jgi:hypothetical protein
MTSSLRMLTWDESTSKACPRLSVRGSWSSPNTVARWAWIACHMHMHPEMSCQ